jgi:hypothetical protein
LLAGVASGMACRCLFGLWLAVIEAELVLETFLFNFYRGNESLSEYISFKVIYEASTR